MLDIFKNMIMMSSINYSLDSSRTPGFCSSVFLYLFNFTRNIPCAKISIIGYGLLRNDSKTLVQVLTEQKFQVVVVDESHYLKTRQAARTKLLVPLLHTAKRVILLTGTPALARPAEVHILHVYINVYGLHLFLSTCSSISLFIPVS